MITLISPSKTILEKDFEIETIEPHFPKEASRLILLLKKKSPIELMSLMKISEALALINMERYANFKKNPSYPAGFLFRGDVYRGLNIDDFSKEEVDFAIKHLKILSGLYGILDIHSAIKPYRLEMGINLENKSGNNLYKFWGDKIASYLKKQNSSEVILNLASVEYSKVVTKSKINLNIVNVEFLQRKNGKLKQVSMFSKYSRGLLARYIVKNKINEVDSLKFFDYEGYSYCDELSNNNKLVFTRQYPKTKS